MLLVAVVAARSRIRGEERSPPEGGFASTMTTANQQAKKVRTRQHNCIYLFLSKIAFWLRKGG